MIVVESSLKDNVALYFFDDKKLMYAAYFTNGNYNEIESSFYFINNAAYRKQANNFKKRKIRLLYHSSFILFRLV